MVLRKYLYFILTIVISFPVITKTEIIEAEIIQRKYDRLYFDSGSENYIFGGCIFKIHDGEDILYSGQIEKVYEGISISHKDTALTRIDLNRPLKIVIEAADIDNESIIFITDSTFSIVMNPPSSDIITENGNSVFYHLPDTELGISEDSDPINNSILSNPDGFLTFNKEPSSNYKNTVSSPYSYIAVLLPNLSKEINRNGMLTTSLYYRFDKIVMPFIYNGDETETVLCLYPSETDCPRSYEYNPGKSHRLNESLKERFSEISIGITDVLLEKAAYYWADILARDRFKVLTEIGGNGNDLFIAWIPYDETDKTIGLSTIVRMLELNEPVYNTQKEALNIIKNNLFLARQSKTELLRNYYLDLVDYSLKYDLGVFPLFQPTVYFKYKPELVNASFYQNGKLDWRKLIKLKLPPSVEGALE